MLLQCYQPCFVVFFLILCTLCWMGQAAQEALPFALGVMKSFAAWAQGPGTGRGWAPVPSTSLFWVSSDF